MQYLRKYRQQPEWLSSWLRYRRPKKSWIFWSITLEQLGLKFATSPKRGETSDRFWSSHGAGVSYLRFGGEAVE